MNHTVAYEKGVSTVAHRACGYRQSEGGGFEDADQSLTSAVLGDGGIYTSLSDYARWDEALYGEQLVSLQTMQEAFEPGHLSDTKSSTGYGFGWRIETRHGVRLLHHDGSTSGFNNAVRRVPEKRLTVVVFTNRAGDHAPRIADQILAEVMAGANAGS